MTVSKRPSTGVTSDPKILLNLEPSECRIQDRYDEGYFMLF